MKGQLIPPPEFAPPSVKHLPVEKRIALWFELFNEAAAFNLAGLRDRIGPDGDLKTAYRQWYARSMQEHDRMQVNLAENLTRRERAK
jgi:hypothetical protein